MQREVIHLSRPLNCQCCCCPCCLQEIEIQSPPGTVIGYVEQKLVNIVKHLHFISEPKSYNLCYSIYPPKAFASTNLNCLWNVCHLWAHPTLELGPFDLRVQCANSELNKIQINVKLKKKNFQMEGSRQTYKVGSTMEGMNRNHLIINPAPLSLATPKHSAMLQCIYTQAFLP